MRYRTWPILVLAFGTLVVLIALSGFSTLQRARRIFGEISSIHENYQNGERVLYDIRHDINLSGLLVRDYLLDPSHLMASTYRQQLLQIRASFPDQVADLRNVIGDNDPAKLDTLGEELDAFWNSLDPIFEWTPQQKTAMGSFFLRHVVLPRRDAAMQIAREIQDLNQANLQRQRRDVEQKEDELPAYVGKMLAITLLLGLLVAGVSIHRITLLERRSEVQRKRTEVAEREMRRLSQQLVRAQEEERRALSRELHDEVGQMLTAQRMELRNLRELRTAPEREFLDHVEDVARLSEQALRSVREIAMGLRPSMLDDLGLSPAVEWQAREFSRRYGVPVNVQIEGELGSLPDSHRTCVYRVVQEALTNCARHAHAKEIRISVHGQPDRLSMTIQDDGVGFGFGESSGRGLGLIGIEERVKELGGKLSIFSQRGKGTVLSAEIPLEVQKETASA